MLTLAVRVKDLGSLKHLAKAQRRILENRLAGSLAVSVNDWRKLVIASTWFNPRPSPTDQILCLWHKEGRSVWRLVFGWTNYRGSAARAQWRVSLRERLFTPKVMARVDRAMRGMPGQGGRE